MLSQCQCALKGVGLTQQPSACLGQSFPPSPSICHQPHNLLQSVGRHKFETLHQDIETIKSYQETIKSYQNAIYMYTFQMMTNRPQVIIQDAGLIGRIITEYTGHALVILPRSHKHPRILTGGFIRTKLYKEKKWPRTIIINYMEIILKVALVNYVCLVDLLLFSGLAEVIEACALFLRYNCVYINVLWNFFVLYFLFS